MATASVLKAIDGIRSPLAECGFLAPEHKKSRKSLEAPLLLTSLIDTFAILVIYLLANFSSSGDMLLLSKDMELPVAQNAVPIERHVTIKVESGNYYLEDSKVDFTDIVPRLLAIRKAAVEMQGAENYQGIITVQADRRATFDVLSPIVQAAGQAGYEEIRFAILPK